MAYLKLLLALVWTTPINVPLLPPAQAPTQQMPSVTTLLAAIPQQPSVPLPPMSPDLSQPATLAPVSWLLGFWLCSICIGLAGVMRAWRRVQLLPRSCALVDDAWLEGRVDELCRQFHIKRKPALLVGGDCGPLLMGVFRPTIILPSTVLKECDKTELHLLLAHELAHLQRRDLLWAWLPAAARILFFFHPAVLLTQREWTMAHEMDCDTSVLLTTAGSILDYSRTLVKVATGKSGSPGGDLLTVGVVESHQTLRRRLISMQNVQQGLGRKAAGAAVVLTGLGIATIVPWQMVASAAESKVQIGANVTGNTSEEAVRNYLISSPRPDRVGALSRVERIITVAGTPTEAKVTGAQTQAVYYKVEVTLPADYVGRRISYLESERVKGIQPSRALDQSVERLKRNRQVIQGRALVEKTPQGWQVLDVRSINSRLDAWALDIYYPKAAESNQQAFTYSARTVRRAEKDSGPLLHKGDLRLWGVPGQPARISSPSLSLSGVLIQIGTKHRNIVAVSGFSELVKIKGEIKPTKGGLPMHFEATCEQAVFDATKEAWSLEGGVKGFYETAQGRKSLNSEVITISRLESQISVMQEVTNIVGGNPRT